LPAQENDTEVVSLDVFDGLFEHLAVVLLDLEDAKRLQVAQLLSALAFAPDSARAVESLGLLLTPGQKRNLKQRQAFCRNVAFLIAFPWCFVRRAHQQSGLNVCCQRKYHD